MNVFGYTVDGERKKAITDLLASNEKIIQNQNSLKRELSVQENSIKRLDEKLESLSASHEDIINVQLKGINTILPSITDRLNTIQVYFENKTSTEKSKEK